MAAAPGARPQAGGSRGPGERDQLVFGRKGAIPLQPSPKALCREAAFKIEKVQAGEQPQAGPERGGTHSRRAAPRLCRGSWPWCPNPPCALQGSQTSPVLHRAQSRLAPGPGQAVCPALGPAASTAAAPDTSHPLSPGCSPSLEALGDDTVTSPLHTQQGHITGVTPRGCCWHPPSWLLLGHNFTSCLDKALQALPIPRVGCIYSGAHQVRFEERLCQLAGRAVRVSGLPFPPYNM